MHRPILVISFLFILAATAAAQSTKFTGRWEQWWDRTASKGIVVELKQRRGLIYGTASGAIPRMYEAEIKPAKPTANGFTARIEDDWGNSATVKFTVVRKRLIWRVIKSDIKGSMTFPLEASLKRIR